MSKKDATKKRTMFRTEVPYGEGYRDAASVMAHETFCLRNTDIPETLTNTILKDSPIIETLNRLIYVIDNELEFLFEDEDFDENGLIIKGDNYNYGETIVVEPFDGEKMVVLDVDGEEIILTREHIDLINIFVLYEDNENFYNKGIDFYKAVLEEIKLVTGKNITYVLWLAEKEDVIKIYGDGHLEDNQIDEYYTSDIVLSDIGVDGKLFGYENAKDCEIDL